MTASKRGRRGDGTMRQRGDSWELKFRATNPATGLREFQYYTLRGTKAAPITKDAARRKLRELTSAADEGVFKSPAKTTVATAIDNWEKTLSVSGKTKERYLELVSGHIRPTLGALRLPELRPSTVEAFYLDLQSGERPKGDKARPLAPLTVGHVHRLLVQILSLAQRDGLIGHNPAKTAKRPRIERAEVEILNEDDARAVLAALRGKPLFLLAALGLATGMRRGEMLGLRWRAIDFDGAKLQVAESLEQTKAGLRFKAPKSRAGRRTITLPGFIVAELRAHKAARLEQRLALRLGKLPDDEPVFCQPSGEPISPDNVSSDWRHTVRRMKLPKVSLHSLRHTHASQLIASGMDVLTISRRLGHAKASVTLDVYGHLFRPHDGGAAAIFEAAFGGV